jgi:hypothetical protein
MPNQRFGSLQLFWDLPMLFIPQCIKPVKALLGLRLTNPSDLPQAQSKSWQRLSPQRNLPLDRALIHITLFRKICLPNRGNG